MIDMLKKSVFAFALIAATFAANAQSMEERSEMPETCLSAPGTLNDDASELVITLACQVFNYELSVANASGEVVFQSKNPSEKWDSALEAAGTYTLTLLGTIGTTVDFTHVKHTSLVVVE